MCNQCNHWCVISVIIEDSLLKVNRAIVMCFKEKQRCCKNSFCLVKEWFYSVNNGGIVDDSLLEANRAIAIYLSNGECTHEF